MGARALFLDRDGTLMIDTGYVRDEADVALLPGVGAALAEARVLGFELVLVSNQSGVGRGIITPDQLAAVERRFETLLEAEGVVLDDVRFCIHHPDDRCACRKPEAGMLRDAAAARELDLERSVMVGDKESDVMAGRNAGCTTILLGGPSDHADHTVASIAEVPAILRRLVCDDDRPTPMP